jgi:hypothetical protein
VSALARGLAQWDGKLILVIARLSNGMAIKTGTLLANKKELSPKRWSRDAASGLDICTVPWREKSLHTVALKINGDVVSLVIEDIRPLSSILQEGINDSSVADEDTELSARDRLLMRRYGGALDHGGPPRKRSQNPTTTSGTSFTVEEIEQAREWWGIIDKWRSMDRNAPQDKGIEADGYALHDLLVRRSRDELAAQIARGEFELIVKSFSND